MSMENTPQNRPDARADTELRSIAIFSDTNPYAEGSAEVKLGSTRVIVTTSAFESQQSDSEGERLNVSLRMLPRSVHLQLTQTDLDQVIRYELESLERLIMQSLYSITPSEVFEHLAFNFSCHVVCSDAGIATAALAACWTAFHQSLRWAVSKELLAEMPTLPCIATISGGISGNRLIIDLCAEEAQQADFTANFVFQENGGLIDIRGSSEIGTIMPTSFVALLNLAQQQSSTVFQQLKASVAE